MKFYRKIRLLIKVVIFHKDKFKIINTCMLKNHQIHPLMKICMIVKYNFIRYPTVQEI